MFNATEFRQIRTVCPEDLTILLHKLGITLPNWEDGDEFKIYAQLDDRITNQMSHLMKSDSVIGGYMDLLSLGKVPFDYSETDNELLAKVISNRDKILKGTVQSPAVANKKPNNAKDVVMPSKTVRRMEQREMSPMPMIVGGAIAVIGLGVLVVGGNMLGLVAVLAGGAGVFAGLKGHTFVREIVSDTPQVTYKPMPSPATNTLKETFTPAEIKNVLDILAQVNKIVQSIYQNP